MTRRMRRMRARLDRRPALRLAACLMLLLSFAIGASGCGLLPSLGFPTTEPTRAESPTPWVFDETSLRHALLTGIQAGQAKIGLETLLIPSTYQDKVYAVFEKLISTEPSAYLCRGTLEYDLSSVDDGKSWTIVDVKPGYQPASVLAAADAWISDLDLASKSPFERIRLLHDRIVLRTAYDVKAAESGASNDSAFTAAGLFSNGSAVCQGYAEAYSILLNRAGVPAVYTSGTAKGIAHAWVTVLLDGKWYHVDPTFDDPVPNVPGQTNYSYFLMTDAQIAVDHKRDGTEPACTDDRYTWMHRMEYVVKLPDGRYAFSDGTDDGAVRTCGDGGAGLAKVPFLLYGKTHDTTRGYYLCVSAAGDLYLSNFSDGAAIYRMKAGEKALTLFLANSESGIYPAKNLYIDGDQLRYDLMDDQGKVTGSYAVSVP